MKKFKHLLFLLVIFVTNSALLAIPAARHESSVFFGIASFYGGNDGFDGKIMANGKIFHSNEFSAATHKNFPIGIWLKVTNRLNGVSVLVKVTDHMPKKNNLRIIDLSKRSAIALQMTHRGLCPVKIEIVHPKSKLSHSAVK